MGCQRSRIWSPLICQSRLPPILEMSSGTQASFAPLHPPIHPKPTYPPPPSPAPLCRPASPHHAQPHPAWLHPTPPCCCSVRFRIAPPHSTPARSAPHHHSLAPTCHCNTTQTQFPLGWFQVARVIRKATLWTTTMERDMPRATERAAEDRAAERPPERPPEMTAALGKTLERAGVKSRAG